MAKGSRTKLGKRTRLTQQEKLLRFLSEKVFLLERRIAELERKQTLDDQSDAATAEVIAGLRNEIGKLSGNTKPTPQPRIITVNPPSTEVPIIIGGLLPGSEAPSAFCGPGPAPTRGPILGPQPIPPPTHTDGPNLGGSRISDPFPDGTPSGTPPGITIG